MTDEFVSPAEPVTMDRWNRYVLPDPETGQKRAWTRITTVTKALSDTYHLEAWKMRMVAKGMATRQDLLYMAEVSDVSEKSTFDNIAKAAMEAAGASEGANKGTARHKLIERFNAGDLDKSSLSETNSVFINAYLDALMRHNVGFMHNLQERVVCIPKYGIAGRFDAVVGHRGNSVIFDLKTQKTVDYGHIELAMQLGFYANASYVWDDGKQGWDTFTVCKDYALLCHAPFTTSEVVFYQVDLSHSVELIEKALAVREARKINGLLTKL